MQTLTAARNAHNEIVENAEIAADSIGCAFRALLMVHDGEHAANFFATVHGEIAMERHLLGRGITARSAFERAMGR